MHGNERDMICQDVCVCVSVCGEYMKKISFKAFSLCACVCVCVCVLLPPFFLII